MYQTIINQQHSDGTSNAFNEITKIEKGMFILVDSPRRIVRVDEVTRQTRVFIENETPIQKDVDVVLVTATLPTKPIEGFVTKLQATSNEKTMEVGYKTGTLMQWKETWRSRSAYRVIRPEGFAVISSGYRNIVSQVYVELRSGHIPDSTSKNGMDHQNIVCSVVTGTILPDELMPRGIFLTPEQRELKKEEAIARAITKAEQESAAKNTADWERQKELAAIQGRELAAAIQSGIPAVPLPVQDEPDATEKLAAIEAKLVKANEKLTETKDKLKRSQSKVKRQRGPRKKPAPVAKGADVLDAMKSAETVESTDEE